MKHGTAKYISECHKRAILARLQAGLKIEHNIARRLYNCEALRSRIADLRRDGWPIETRMQKFIAPSGLPGKFAVYSLPKGAQNRIWNEETSRAVADPDRAKD